jgi:hypothetical protein
LAGLKMFPPEIAAAGVVVNVLDTLEGVATRVIGDAEIQYGPPTGSKVNTGKDLTITV